jgi:hypothetical protein
MDRSTILQLWNTAWERGLGFAPWKDVLNGLTPAQAAWSPGKDRHSIWAHVAHMCFWREYIASAARGQATPSDEDVHRLNFAGPESSLHAAPEAWADLQSRFAESHRLLARLYADPSVSHDWMWGLVGHDSYHVGQVMLLRALQGIRPLM